VRIRVLVIESTPMASQLLADALREVRGVEVIGSASRATDGIEAVADLQPEVVLVSDALDGQPSRGFRLAREIRAAAPDARIVMLLDHGRASQVVEAFRAGARGVFSRNDSLTTLGECILKVGRGGISASQQQVDFILEALRQGVAATSMTTDDLRTLSRREQEVARALVEGRTNREIAELMGLSRHTVKNHIFRIFEKLEVSNRIELITVLNQRQRDQNGSREGASDQHDFRECLLAAAESGIASAQFILGQMYLTGEGTHRDKVLAYKWLMLAEQANQSFSSASRVARKSLATEMLSAQIAEAERLVLQWTGTSGHDTWGVLQRGVEITAGTA
jgi:DNA-binding NarL/FixJ family response regulator